MNSTVERLQDSEYEKAIAERINLFMKDCKELTFGKVIEDVFWKDVAEVIGLSMLSQERPIAALSISMLVLGA